MNTAYFVKEPNTIQDLLRPHRIEEERAYRICKRVCLSAMAYENCITDLTADRAYIEANSELCSDEGTLRGIFVHRRGASDGVLLVSGTGVERAYVKWAAYLPRAHGGTD